MPTSLLAKSSAITFHIHRTRNIR
ncbi:hypothetical protein V12B01_12880 [Vibrio splendidus 12B01]|nr:hypothetical protein V12B01_12880 [Vibrio splendidus 12B01]